MNVIEYSNGTQHSLFSCFNVNVYGFNFPLPALFLHLYKCTTNLYTAKLVIIFSHLHVKNQSTQLKEDRSSPKQRLITTFFAKLNTLSTSFTFHELLALIFCFSLNSQIVVNDSSFHSWTTSEMFEQGCC